MWSSAPTAYGIGICVDIDVFIIGKWAAVGGGPCSVWEGGAIIGVFD